MPFRHGLAASMSSWIAARLGTRGMRMECCGEGKGRSLPTMLTRCCRCCVVRESASCDRILRELPSTRRLLMLRFSCRLTIGIVASIVGLLGPATAHADPLNRDPSIKLTWQGVEGATSSAKPFSNMPRANQPFLSIENGLPSDCVTAIARLPNGSTGFGTNHGLAIVGDGMLTLFTGPDHENKGNIGGSLPSNEINDILAARDGSLWVATTRGLCKIREAKIEKLVPTSSILSDVFRLLQASDGRILIGSRYSGITIVEADAVTALNVFHDDDINHWVTGIGEDSRKRFWFGIRGVGVARYEGTSLKIFRGEPWIPDENVRALAVDRSDNVWVGTNNGLGLFRPDGTSEVFRSKDGLPGDLVWRITVGRSGVIWAFTDGGLAAYRGQTWVYPAMESRPGCCCMVLYEAPDGTTWFGGRNGIVFDPLLSLQSRSPADDSLDREKSEVAKSFPAISTTKTRLLDGAGRVWIHRHNVLLRYDGKIWEDLTHLLGSAWIAFVNLDSQGRVWVGTSGAGLIGFENERLRQYNNDPESAKSVIYDMAEGKGGVLFVGTQAGLYTLDGDNWNCLTEQLLPYVFLQPLHVVLDSEGRVWFDDPNEGVYFIENHKAISLSEEKLFEGFKIDILEATPDGQVRLSGIKRTQDGAKPREIICRRDKCKDSSAASKP